MPPAMTSVAIVLIKERFHWSKQDDEWNLGLLRHLITASAAHHRANVASHRVPGDQFGGCI